MATLPERAPAGRQTSGTRRERGAGDAARPRRSMPMFVRVFGIIVVMVIAGIWAFGTAFTVYQDRTTAATLAPLWAEAVRASLAAPSDARTTARIVTPVEVLGGEPPAAAVELTNDGRMKAVAQAMEERGVAVRQLRLDDSVDPPITWLRVDRGGGVSRWVGIVGGLQPSDFRRRLFIGLATMVAIVIVFTALVSRWVTAPVSRLVEQLDGVARGELPQVRVRGAREIERLGDALRSMAERRHAAEEQMRAMLLGVSHDLRSPLARIRVAADLLDGDSARLRDVLVRNVEQADAIIESFLTYVRAEAETPHEPLDLAEVARAAAAITELPTAQTKLPAPPATVRGDSTLLQRAAVNLIENAQRHGAAPVTLAVAVAADAAKREAALTVDDAGPGLADPARLRRPFERGDAARGTAGSGLGLAIVDRIAERHGGRVEIERNPNGGARVVLRLPLA